MAARRRWRDLGPRTRALLVTAGAAEGALKVVALADLARRPAAQVRGPRWAWAVALILVNSGGGAPLAYLRFGRREPHAAPR